MRKLKLHSILTVAALSLLAIAPHSAVALQGELMPSGSTAVALPQTAPLLLAQQSRVRRVQFPQGASSTTIADAVVRGTRDIYLLGASKGQTMTVKLASLENNAVFELKTPANKVGQRRNLKLDAVNWTGKLPETGDYQIVVGGTRGNASYKLQVSIK